jgi:hypothetical protein
MCYACVHFFAEGGIPFFKVVGGGVGYLFCLRDKDHCLSPELGERKRVLKYGNSDASSSPGLVRTGTLGMPYIKRMGKSIFDSPVSSIDDGVAVDEDGWAIVEGEQDSPT